MATTWTHNGWRRESGATAQRTMLILHIEEVEQAIAAFQSQGAMSQRAQRFDLIQYHDRLAKELEKLDRQTGTTPGEAHVLIQGKPRMTL